MHPRSHIQKSSSVSQDLCHVAPCIRRYRARFCNYLPFTIYHSPVNYQRIKTPPHVTPPPNEANSTKSPVLIFPASTHSSSPIGIDADDVLPCMAMFE